MNQHYLRFPTLRLSVVAAATIGLIVQLLTGLTAKAQVATWQMAVGGSNPPGTTGLSYITGTAMNAAGEVFVVGTYSEQVTFGTTVLTSAGGEDVFLAKWNPAANAWVWAVSAGGTNIDQGKAIAISGNNVYITGTFLSDNNVHFGSTLLTGAGSLDIFLAKYVDNGASVSLGWATSAGGNADDASNAIAVSGNNLYITGQFQANSITVIAGVVFDGLGITTRHDLFVAKYIDNVSSVGNGWARSDGHTGDVEGTGIAVNGANVYVTGTLYLAPLVTIAGTLVSNAGLLDLFLAKYIDTGTAAADGWATSGGGNQNDYAQAVAVNGTNVYVSGSFRSGTNSRIAGTTLSGKGHQDTFLAKYIDSGPGVANGWVTTGGGSGDDEAVAIAVNGASVYITGIIANDSTASIAGTHLTAPWGWQLFAAKYSDAGSTVTGRWAINAESSEIALGLCIAVSHSNVFVAGVITSPTTFGTTTLSTLPRRNNYFLAKLNSSLVVGPPPTGTGPLVLPNPNSGRFTLVLTTADFIRSATTATLYNALGQLVRTIATPTAETVVDVRGLPAGIYTLRLLVEGVPVARRVVLE